MNRINIHLTYEAKLIKDRSVVLLIMHTQNYLNIHYH